MRKLFVGIFALFFIFAVQAKKTMTGIEVLKEQNFKLLEGKNVGLITNATGVDNNLKSTIDILYEAPNVKLVALYGPEHGVRGNIYAGGTVNNEIDEKTGISVFSLYGKTRKPTSEMLKGVDVLVYDIQDIGCRSYTYISTLGLAMEAAAENNIEFIVLDRPNPLGGEKIEGNITEETFISFVSQFKIPYIYGLTCGELALMLNEENMLKKKCKLTIVKMKNWNRDMKWEDTGLEWIISSPHIPHKHSPCFYPATGILGELNHLSIGVGYTLPFQIVAAPWIKADELAKAMNQLNLQGLIFRPIYLTPFYGTFKGENCQGVQIHITDYKKASLSEIQFYMIDQINKLYPDKNIFLHADSTRFLMFDKVCGTDQIRLTLQKNGTINEILEIWNKDKERYHQLSKKYYLYK